VHIDPRQLDPHPISDEDPDEVAIHPIRDMRHDVRALVQPHAIQAARQQVSDPARQSDL
jgi:hypothetical protein